MNLKKTDKIIDELASQLFIIEGEITDLLTRETMQNLNESSQNTTGAIAVSSALAGQIGSAALASFAASDDGIEVSDFALEVTDQEGLKHYFTGCFPVIIFKKGDTVKVIAEPDNEKYARAAAIIDQKKSYIWTAQEVVKGRLRYRIFGMKGGLFFGFLGVMTFCLFAIFDGKAGIIFLTKSYILITLLTCLLASLLIGWRIGASFDSQSFEFEAILKKLGFNKPSRMDFQKYALTDLSWQGKEKDFEHERWKDYTYRIDLAKQYDEEKYGKK